MAIEEFYGYRWRSMLRYHNVRVFLAIYPNIYNADITANEIAVISVQFLQNKWRIVLYYVMQVAAGTEDKVEEQIKVMIGNELYDSCFHPMRRMKKKYRGEWKDVHDKLLPGYVFITSECIQELYRELRCMPAFTKILGKDIESFTSLPKHEVEWIERIMDSSDQNIEIQLSKVSVSEDDVIEILSGPLKHMKGYIKKIDLHRRIAKVEVDFMNQKTLIHLGIEMVEKR